MWHDEKPSDETVSYFWVSYETCLRLAEKTLKPGGILIMSTFAPDGPDKCSNLQVNRYDCDDLWRILGQKFKLISRDREIHQTPFQTQQAFSYCVFQKL